MVFGLTGGIASGKSTVARLLAELGATVIDADQVAREVVAPGTPGLARVIEAFGEDVLQTDGSLDRRALGARTFGNEGALRELNGILHPLIAARSGEAIGNAMAEGRVPIVYEAALLVESGRARDFMGLIVVWCSPEVQLRRLMERESLTQAEAEARIASQLPQDEKVRQATWAIRNDDGLDALAAETRALYATLRSACGLEPEG
jgi:dephospho-CoA kinase